MSKLNKNILVALAVAFLGISNVSKADAEDSLMSNRLAVKVTGGLNFGSADNYFKAVKWAGFNDDKDVKADNFKWNVGGALEYEWFLNPYIGVGLNVDLGYQKLYAVSFGKNDSSNANQQNGNTNSDNAKEVAFSGCYLNPTLRIIGNFLEDGLIFDEEEEQAAGFKAGVFMDCGGGLNFGSPDYSKIDNLKDNKKAQLKLNLFNFCLGGGAFFELPLGIGMEVGYKAFMGQLLDHVEGKGEGSSSSENKDVEFVRHGVNISIFYDFGNFLA